MQEHTGGVVTGHLLVTADTRGSESQGQAHTHSAPGVLLRRAASTSRDANPAEFREEENRQDI